ncbi:hypothetical protein [Methylobacterium nonmethylotrophicum]|uniref:Uncharacterized protein n=1 Tax=Methylobacterium nonmethylotrophicum TaxID=1141884 RepID=A0A4Z0NT90_9HYPH|nr:hypothetical protein [Methylobacterium nonmethylotrophicum]TGE00638.1 hypothetical protein EU555_07775 [Methylobacterium nonmethylotrophicum]
MPHFSADLLDAFLDGDPEEREALRALLASPSPASGTVRPAPSRDASIRDPARPTVTGILPAATSPTRTRTPRDGKAGRRPAPRSGQPSAGERSRGAPRPAGGRCRDGAGGPAVAVPEK